jgi:hypothetical protein
MPAEPDHPATELCDLRQRLDAERAAVEHWRRIAMQREEQFSALIRRPEVRLLLAVERRIAPALTHAGAVGRRLRGRAERLALTTSALPRSGRRRPLERPVAPARAASATGRRLAIVVVGPSAPVSPGVSSPRAEVTRVTEPLEVRAAICKAIKTSNPDLVGVVAASSEPLDAGWMNRLASAITGSAVAAVPVVAHPVRPLRRATPHDGRVRAAGVGLRLDGLGTPWAEALGAGTELRTVGEPVEVDAGTGAALLVDSAAYRDVGGLAAIDDLDAAAVELCTRLRSRGGRVVLVPGTVVVDHRTVQARRDLRRAVDPSGPGWAAAIERSGAVLRRAADPRSNPPLRLAMTVAAPSARVAARWGDWHLAQALAGSLRRLGHDVRLQTADQADSLAGRACDVHVVLRGLHPVRASEGQRQVLWVISHPEAIDDGELEEADLILVAAPRFADHLRSRTRTPVEVMLQATDHRRFSPRPPDPAHRHDVTVVAKTRDVLRPVVADALAADLRPAIYGGGWRQLVDPSLVVADRIDNELLPTVYSSAALVLNDHWATMKAWGFVSNRLFDVLACGTPVISDAVDGLAELFEGAVLEYQTPAELRALVDDVLADQGAARERAARGRSVVLTHHTIDHRAGELLAALTAISGGELWLDTTCG